MKAVLTDNRREFCGTERHAYEPYIDLNDLKHRHTKILNLESKNLPF